MADVADRRNGTDLSARQAAFVAAITGTGEAPDGFDAKRVEVARRALLTKRAGELAAAWPAVARSLGDQLGPLFAAWAERRPTRGAAYDGREFARAHWGQLDHAARREVIDAEARIRFADGKAEPRAGLTGISLRRRYGRLRAALASLSARQ